MHERLYGPCDRVSQSSEVCALWEGVRSRAGLRGARGSSLVAALVAIARQAPCWHAAQPASFGPGVPSYRSPSPHHLGRAFQVTGPGAGTGTGTGTGTGAANTSRGYGYGAWLVARALDV